MKWNCKKRARDNILISLQDTMLSPKQTPSISNHVFRPQIPSQTESHCQTLLGERQGNFHFQNSDSMLRTLPPNQLGFWVCPSEHTNSCLSRWWFWVKETIFGNYDEKPFGQACRANCGSTDPWTTQAESSTFVRGVAATKVSWPVDDSFDRAQTKVEMSEWRT